MSKIAESIEPPITGLDIIEIIKNPEKQRQHFAEGLIYERSCVMFASHPGVGKSILLVQMSMELSAGLPVFGSFNSRKCKVYYVQKERAIDEIIERVGELKKHIPWCPENVVFDTGLQTFNLANEKNHDWIIERINKHKPDIVILDPIGAGTPGLSKDEPANIFCNFLTALQAKTGATIVLGHHSTKDSYSTSGDKIVKDDPFYGSQWIKAHVTGSYHIEETEDGRLFTCKKNSHNNLVAKFNTFFDMESMVSSTAVSSMSNIDKAKHFFNSIKNQNKKFKAKDLTAYLGCATRTSRNILCTPPFDEASKKIIRHKSNGGATLYEVADFF